MLIPFSGSLSQSITVQTLRPLLHFVSVIPLHEMHRCNSRAKEDKKNSRGGVREAFATCWGGIRGGGTENVSICLPPPPTFSLQSDCLQMTWSLHIYANTSMFLRFKLYLTQTIHSFFKKTSFQNLAYKGLNIWKKEKEHLRVRLMRGSFFCYLSLSGARLSFITYA